MPNVRTLQRSFAGGEVSPEMYGRIDDVKYQSGLAKCQNFITKPQGPAENRPGFQYVKTVKDSSKPVRLIPFTYSNTQTMIVEMGLGYMRFHSQGATLMTDGKLHYPTEAGYTPYEISTPYTQTDQKLFNLFDVHYVQSGDVMTLTHPYYPPKELRRYGANDWRIAAISFAAPISAPTGVTATASNTAVPAVTVETKYDYYYVVTSIAVDGIGESAASSTATVKSNVFQTGTINTITWSAVTGATRYYIYKQQGGMYGYIGSTTTTSLIDDNIAPDLSRTPPTYDDPFTKAGSITAVAVTSGGSGYSAVTKTGGGFTAVSWNGSLLDYRGGASDPPTLTVKDPTGTGATFKANVYQFRYGHYSTTWAVSSFSVLTAGSGYTNPVFELTWGGLGLPQFSTQNMVYMLTPVGTNASAPVINVTDATGSGAKLEAIVTGGVITGVNVIDGGTNYSASPSVSLTASSGSGAVLGAVTTNATGDNPAAVSYYEQRRVFAGTTYKPQNIWMTKSGTESNMSYSLPIRDDDRIAFRVAAREANQIRHIVPLSQLLILTGAAEWRVTSINSDAITPSSVAVRPQSYIGASNAQPVIVNNNLIYGAARGGHVRECSYNWQANGYITGDLSLRSAHLFDSYDIVDIAYSKAPQPILWFISSAGKLLGLTYVPEQQVGAWHQHVTDGSFQSCAVISENGEDMLYVVVGRVINGSYVRYIERLASRKFVDPADAFFVDSGLTYDGTEIDPATGLPYGPKQTFSNLGHLEGCTVNILADGAVHPQRVVTSGSITLDIEATKVQIGLPIIADLQTLPVAMQVDGSFGQGRYKNVNKAWLRVFRSGGIFIGPNSDNLTEAKQRKEEPYGSPPALKSEEIQVMLTPSWADGGQVYVRQSDPLPLTIASLTLEISVGG